MIGEFIRTWVEGKTNMRRGWFGATADVCVADGSIPTNCNAVDEVKYEARRRRQQWPSPSLWLVKIVGNTVLEEWEK